ncbi:hypothetical protein RUM43_010556 [Polyplax serrata]|uniref:C2H2-type domain-containing protein n=1 Tax=Polyplax serrata TaxID=468196 RepID=A0AAN8Q516_POLSC
MPKPETTKEVNYKQPTGSSKRKRKQSIKRNIVNDSESNCNDSVKSKTEKTYGKRSKSAKVKEHAEENLMDDRKSKTVTCPNEITEIIAPLHGEQSEEEKLNVENLAVSKCSSNKQQCQNCKFCSEHKEIKSEADDSSNCKRSKKKFPCEICAKDGTPKVYNTLEKHKQHMATVHEIYSKEVKRFECTECSQTVWFPTKSKYMYHLGTKHPGIIKFICEVCTETFKLKANYKNHMKSHNIVVQKKFACDVCNGTFVNKAGFEAHKRRFPGPHIKQSCSHCGFSFSREKHLINHRCKTLLLEEAAARTNSSITSEPKQDVQQTENASKFAVDHVKVEGDNSTVYLDKKTTVDPSVESETDTQALNEKKPVECDSQSNKKMLVHRIIPRRNQDQAVYRPVQVATQNVPESVVVQELREIELENGTFIAAAPSGDPEQQFIIRDINGQIVQGGQIFQLDINDVQPGEESQVYLADWNIVAPYVIREKSP